MESDRRKDPISWEQYFMGVAFLSSKRSKDPHTQVGACIVNNNNRILSIGYNGMPNGCSDKIFPWTKDSEDPSENKYYYVVHAELNAILNYKGDLTGTTIYTTLFPCQECTKAIIQAGIKEVVYFNIKKGDSPEVEAALKMFNCADVKIRQYINGSTAITLEL